ncbi:MAG TPA: hypothetical protein VLF17_03805 [Candidatus Nitrosotenuis sp.]|nr:hypothetical protein [Candidatus Nitrosotenuis sp.]
MKTYLILVMMLAMAVFTVADAHALMDPKQSKDQPNFHPKVTKEKINGKNLEVVEFQCKLAK